VPRFCKGNINGKYEKRLGRKSLGSRKMAARSAVNRQETQHILSNTLPVRIVHNKHNKYNYVYVLALSLNVESKGLVSNLVHCIKKSAEAIAWKIEIAASVKLHDVT
jgi:hypothetical protein